MFRDQGVFTALEDPETALAYDYSAREKAHMDMHRSRALVGKASDVADRIRTLSAETGVDELAIVTWAHDEAARHKSYQLLANEFDLAGNQTLAAE